MDGLDYQIRNVAMSAYQDDSGWRHWLYGDEPFTFLQIVYPATAGLWPRDVHAPSEISFVAADAG